MSDCTNTTLYSKLKLIVGGTTFVVRKRALRKLPQTTLASLTQQSPYYNATQDAYYFNRSPDVFYSVLNYYRYGELHLPKYLCGNMVRRELEFWKIPDFVVAECCLGIFNEILDNKTLSDKLNEAHDNEDFNEGLDSPLSMRNKVWLTLEYPNYSVYSKIWHYCYIFVVLLSACVFMIWNEEIVRVPSYVSKPIHIHKDMASTKVIRMLEKDPAFGILCVDMFCMIFYSVELFVHFVVSPVKRKFIRSGMTILNMCHIGLMWFVFTMEFYKDFTFTHKPLAHFYFLATGCNALRLLMIFRVSKNYTALKVLLLALKESWEELRLLLVTFFLGVTVFGTVIYYCEIQDDNMFSNIFESIWWAIITMTTVGYGDLYPQNVVSRIVGSLCAVCGVMILTVPIAIVATNFSEFYKQEKYRKRRLQNSKKTADLKRESLKNTNNIDILKPNENNN